jgi:hypothetical protein
MDNDENSNDEIDNIFNSPFHDETIDLKMLTTFVLEKCNTLKDVQVSYNLKSFPFYLVQDIANCKDICNKLSTGIRRILC